MTFKAAQCSSMRSPMDWNTKPPSYSKNQSSLLHQWLRSQVTPASPNSFSSPRSSQESCMYSSDSHPAMQPLLTVQTYKTPQILGANLQNRTPVSSQTSVEQRTYKNAPGHQPPNLNLQMSSGILNGGWLNPHMTNSLPHTEAAVPHQTDLGSNMPNVHTVTGHFVPAESYPAPLQMAPSSLLGSVSVQGSERLNPSLLDAQQYVPSDLTYPENRPLAKKYIYTNEHGLVQVSGVEKPSILPSTSLQVQNNLHLTPAQTVQPMQTMSIATYQCAAEKRSLPLPLPPPPAPAPPYSCQYKGQPVPSAQSALKQLSQGNILPKPEAGSLEMAKDSCKSLQQWQSTNENRHVQRKLYNWQVKQPFHEPVEPVVSMQTLAASNQGQMNSYIPTSGQIVDSSDVTKEKLVRDIKSLIEIKKKFSEIARKIKINQKLLRTRSSKTAQTLYTGSAQPSELSSQVMPAKSDGQCSMELLATCLSLWQKSPAQGTDDSTSKLSIANQNVVPTTHTTAVSEPAKEGPGNSHVKMADPSQVTALSLVVNQNFESPTVNTTKGTELQIAVVSPLILSQDKTLPVKAGALESLPEPVYPVIKEGSICSLQDQLAQSTRVAAALHVVNDSRTSELNRLLKETSNAPGERNSQYSSNADVSKLLPVPEKEKQNEAGTGNSQYSCNTDVSKLLPVAQKEKQNEAGTGNSEALPAADLGRQSPLADPQALCESKHSDCVTCDTLQIGNICSLVEGNTAYDSQIASIFKSTPQKNTEAHGHPPDSKIIHGEQQKGLNACERKNFDVQKELFVHSADNPPEIPSQSRPAQSQEPSPGVDCEVNRKDEEKNMDCVAEKECPDQKMCSSSPSIQPNSCHQETHVSSSYTAEDPTISDNADNSSVLYLQDQLSELVKEFPYGIETMSLHKGSVDQQMTAHISDNPNGREMASDSKGSIDQIQITVLSSERMKEIFPEEQLVEAQKEKPVRQADNQCASVTPMGENTLDHMADKLEDKVHCCALGWLSVLYEGVPHCECKATKSATKSDEGKVQHLSLETSISKGGEATPDEDLTIIECISVSSKSKALLTPMAQKSNLPGLPSNGRKNTTRIKHGSTQTAAKDLAEPAQAFSKYDRNDQKDTSKKNLNKSIKIRQECTGPPVSKDNKLDPLQSHKRKRKWKFHENTANAYSRGMGCTERASQEKLLKKGMPQPAAAQTVPTMTSPQGINGSSTHSAAPPKKLKFRAGASKLIYLEKRKLDPGTTSDLKTKKKKMEHPQHAESTPKSDNVLSSQNESASVKERAESNPVSSSRSKITLQEYMQRQKQRQMVQTETDKASKKVCVDREPFNPHFSTSHKGSVHEGSSRKASEESPSGGPSKDQSNSFVSQDKALKTHHPPKELKTHISRSGKEKVTGKEPDKSKLEKTLSNVSAGAGASQRSPQGKGESTAYLNRVAFKCTEGESIRLTKLGSVPQKHHRDQQNQEPKPKTLHPERPNMLEFKLCPDLLLKNPTSSEECRDLKACPKKEQAPVQGMKSTKEDWLKCGMTTKRMEENNREMDNANSRMYKRSSSADVCATPENSAKDSSKAVFQTYKQMYLEKRSRSLGDSPVK